MDDTFYDKELDRPYDCEHCNDTGKLEGSDSYDCGHCGVAQERVALEQRVMPGVRFDNVADVLYREVRIAKRTAKAIAAADLALLKAKLLQAERRAAQPVVLSDEQVAEICVLIRPDDFKENDEVDYLRYDGAIARAILAAKEQA